MMNDIRVRVWLKKKETGEPIDICVPLYDDKNGLLNFPIDLKVYDVIRIDRGSGINDVEEFEIFERDKVNLVVNAKNWKNCDILKEYNLSEEQEYVVKFEEGCFCLEGKTTLSNIQAFLKKVIKGGQ